MHIIDELEARRLLQDISARPELTEMLSKDCVSFYVGFDPTATSLHVGNLVPIISMARLQRAGHKPYALVGGATGMIGDPSGKSDERNLLDEDTLRANVAAIEKQLSRFLDFGDGKTDAVMVNNHDWFAPIGYLEFLRDVGKHITINYMMAKDSVKARLSGTQGISYTEFSYMLLQGYDFVSLARDHGCRLQIGGSDQWGNITAGIELGRKVEGLQLYGWTAPLLLDSKGEKMGKTAGGLKVWLDPEQTSPYAFYQYWLNVDDADVDKLLRVFSWRPLDEIEAIVSSHQQTPHKRAGQRALAEDMTRWVHGDDALTRAVAASQVMFGGSLDNLTDDDLKPLLADVPSSVRPRADLDQGIGLLDLLVATGLAKSKGAGRRLIQSGGVYLNNIQEKDVDRSVSHTDLATATMLVLRAGKKNYHILQTQ